MFRLLHTSVIYSHKTIHMSWASKSQLKWNNISKVVYNTLCYHKSDKIYWTSITLSQCPPCVISLSLNIIRLKEEEEALKRCCVNSHDHRFQLSKKKFSQHIKKSCWYSCVKSLQSADSFLRAMLSLTLVADTEIHLPLWSGMHISNLCILVFNVNTEAANTDK